MTFTYTPTDAIGKVRMLIPDRVEEHAVFTDEEIQAYLELNDSNVRRAAAQALETIASDEVMTLKVLTTLDITTNGASVSDALLRRAEGLRKQADDADAGEEGGSFDYGELNVNAFTSRELLRNQFLRED